MIATGKCSECGGVVGYGEFWGGPTPPPVSCQDCGATPKIDYAPVVPMRKPETSPRPRSKRWFER